MVRSLLAAVLVVALLSGCVQTEPEGPAPADPVLQVSRTFTCPPGPTGESVPGICIQRMAHQTESYQEPDLAVHPHDPDIMALGFIHGRAPGDVLVDTYVERARVDLLVTTDGGATWEARTPPSVRLTGLRTGTLLTGDPSLAFSSDGTLHYSAMAATDIVYAASEDLGATWRDAVALTYETGDTRAPDGSGGGTDRNWLTVLPDDRIVVTWQRPSDRSEFAVSSDNGATWSVHTPSTLTGCVTVSPAIALGDRVLLSCTVFEGDEDTGVQIHALDLVSGTTALLAETPFPLVFTALHVVEDDRLVVTGTDRSGTALVAASDDGGYGWGDPVDVRTLVEEDDGWTHAYRYASAVDAAGDLHVILGGIVRTDLPSGEADDPQGKIHVVLSGATLLASEETRVTPESSPVSDASPITYSDHFGAIRPRGDDLVLVWGRSGGLDVARIDVEIRSVDSG